VASQPQQNNDKQKNQVRADRMSFSPIHALRTIIWGIPQAFRPP